MRASMRSTRAGASATSSGPLKCPLIAPRACVVARASKRSDRHLQTIDDASTSSTSTSSSSTSTSFSSSPFSSAATALALSLAFFFGAPCASALAAEASSVFFDITVDGEPAGRLLVDLLGRGSSSSETSSSSSSSNPSALAPIGVARFAELAEDRDGVGYVRSKIDGIEKDRVIRSSGVASLAYRDSGGVRPGVAAPSRIPGGDTVEDLEKELEAQRGSADGPKHDRAGVVSLVVKDPPGTPPPKTRLVAINGKFVNVEEPRKGAPNGTAFVITMAPAPELDDTNLVVGTLREGRELVERLSELKVSSNRSDSAFFKVAKATGDRRADAAAKFFYRPFQKVVIVNSGKM